MWEKIELSEWKSIPCIMGRSATEADISAGIAVFAIPSGSEPVDVQLPLAAIQIDSDSGSRTPCIAIQIEQSPDGAFVGVRYLGGGNGVGAVDEFELYTELTDEFDQ